MRLFQVVHFSRCFLVHYYTLINREWLSVLEASYIIFRLPPFYKNYNKRLIKNPKIYFLDTGLACHLLGIHTIDQYLTHYYKGSIFETFILSELLKNNYHNALGYRFYFWRDNHRKKIDVIIERGEHLKIVEIKSAKTFQFRYLKNITEWMKLTNTPAKDTCLIWGSNERFSFKETSILSWKEIFSFLNTTS